MSLVNDMLRDLDQRRKESDHAGTAVGLMPASDYVKEGGKKALPFVLAGLILLLVALAYYWIQFGQTDSRQQLDIRVQPMAATATDANASESQTLIEELEESIVQAEGSAIVQPEVVVAPASNDASIISSIDIAPSAIIDVEIEEPNTQVILLPENLDAAVQVAAAIVQPPVEFADPQLLRDRPVESVKEAPEFSTEQLDTIAVQKALGQIANGQADAAYTTLGDYISQNQHAHQSRETYAKLLMSQGRVVDASALIDAGLELAPNHAGFKKVKARLLMADGQVSEAVDILISRAPDVTEDAEYHDLLASAQLSSRDFSGAVISYTGLVQTDERQGKWWYGFAAAHDQLGNVRAARQAYTRAMQFSNLSASLRRRSQERLGELNP